jgi:asparagine synthase (glutamine-hydrolysing)
MCGIFAILNNKYDESKTYKLFMKGAGRGPDTNQFINYKGLVGEKYDIDIGFHRLAINGYNDDMSDQPFQIKNCMLICNGEIYNWKYLYDVADIEPGTKSDCEVIIHLYKKYGIEYTLRMLDGVFAFVLFDIEKGVLYAARDLYGVRPMFVGEGDWSKGEPIMYGFASEMKQLVSDGIKSIRQLEPGTYATFKCNTFNNGVFRFTENNRFLDIPCGINNTYNHIENYYEDVYESLCNAVEKRVDNTDRDICCLLSGGLDSSLIASIVNRYYRERFPNKKLHTWSIGMDGSEDLKYAKQVADFLGTKHHSIELTKEEFLNVIPRVVYDIESYDTTTVRASVGNWLISKYISEGCDAKVVFNGDGSDEVCGGYMYFHAAPDALEFDKECKRLLKDIHFFDVLRSDRSISTHGLEARTPFLDKHFVETYLSIPPDIRFHAGNGVCEKYILRKAFDGKKMLPKEVLWRTKEAFSDGVSSSKESWFQTIQKMHHDEKKYYKTLFYNYFQGHDGVIPYYWMPRFVEATDASARTLDIYNKVKNGKLQHKKA